MQVGHAGKSYSVIVPSAESVAQSKLLLMNNNPTPSTKPELFKHIGYDTADPKASSAEKIRRQNGSLLVYTAQKSPETDLQTPEPRSEDGECAVIQPLKIPQCCHTQEQAADYTEEDMEAQSSKKTSFVTQKYSVSQANQKGLNVIEERLESQDSALSDPNLSPRSRHFLKLQKKIKYAFLKSGSPPET